jgi:hypothetical protein
MVSKKLYQRVMAILALLSLLLVLSLSLLMQTSGDVYTVGQLDGMLHDQAQQISQCISLDKTIEMPQLQDYLLPVMLLLSCFLFQIYFYIKVKNLLGYGYNTLVSLRVRIND